MANSLNSELNGQQAISIISVALRYAAANIDDVCEVWYDDDTGTSVLPPPLHPDNIDQSASADWLGQQMQALGQYLAIAVEGQWWRCSYQQNEEPQEPCYRFHNDPISLREEMALGIPGISHLSVTPVDAGELETLQVMAAVPDLQLAHVQVPRDAIGGYSANHNPSQDGHPSYEKLIQFLGHVNFPLFMAFLEIWNSQGVELWDIGEGDLRIVPDSELDR